MVDLQARIRTLFWAAAFLEDEVLNSTEFKSQCKRDMIDQTISDPRTVHIHCASEQMVPAALAWVNATVRRSVPREPPHTLLGHPLLPQVLLRDRSGRSCQWGAVVGGGDRGANQGDAMKNESLARYVRSRGNTWSWWVPNGLKFSGVVVGNPKFKGRWM